MKVFTGEFDSGDVSATSGSTEPLSVVLNRERLNDVSVPAEFTAVGPFQIAFQNEGEPVHVHIRPEGRLADVASLPESNQYVERESELRVPVTVSEVDESVTGTLAVVTGHGSHTERVEVTVEPPEPATPATAPDTPTNGEPSEPRDTPPSPSASGSTTVGGGLPADPATLLVAGLIVLAILLGIVAQLSLGSAVVTLGVIAVFAAVGGAAWILLRE